MPQDSRTVRRLVLRSPRAAVGHAAFLIEDGLRTATLSGSERQLIIVRSIALGVIDPHDSPVALSRRIERKWHEVARYAVPAESEDARFAPAVTFRSIEHAFAVWLCEVVRGVRPADWFWRRILPRNADLLSAPEAFSVLATRIARPPDGSPFNVVDFVEEIAKRGMLKELASLLEVQHVQPLLETLLPGSPLMSWPLPVSRFRSERIELPRIYRQALVRRVSEREEWDGVAYFFAAAGVASERPWLLGSAGTLSAEVERRIASVRQLAAAIQTQASPQPPAGASLTGVKQPHTEPVAYERSVSPEPQFQDPRSAASASPGQPAQEDRPESAPPPEEIPAAATANSSAEFSAYAGLFFVLPVLSRIGVDELVSKEPALLEEGLIPLLLAAIATSAGAPGDDPALTAIDAPVQPDRPELLSMIKGLHRGARNYVRREARMLLSWMVRRTGRIVYSRTHTDVFFDLNQADLRLRTLGLDIDPGWVPALGKVITYHYGSDDF